ncbi:MAG: HAD-IA family hydrolase [Methylococcaceae bacterium]|nr:HAD-IA family hydrolase [Methylococcaceae bacterium]
MKEKVDLIIFDWDGTLVDSIDWIVLCLSEAAESCGCEVPENQILKDTIGLSIERTMTRLFPKISPQIKARLISYYRQKYLSKQITKDDLFVGVNQMLIELKQKGYQLAVATGKSRLELDKAMQGTGLYDFFNSTRTADQTASKPQPDMLDEIIEETGVSRKRAVMVGDSVHDMEMAINAGIAMIAVSCGANTYDQLQQFNPLINLPQTTQILDIL